MSFNVLFLCTGNSARSILAEAILNHVGMGKFRAFSAGSHPTGKVNPYALQLLERMRIPTWDARSKSWDEFAQAGAPVLDFVFTVCGNAAGEVCPVWPGQPVTAHWGVEDPAAVDGDEMAKVNAFRRAFNVLEHRIRIFANLPMASLDRQRLSNRVREIGTSLPGE
jgi:arsenate reductase (thioredoxin)